MSRFDIEAEKVKWEHPYRIQVTKPLHKREIATVIDYFRSQETNCAVEKRGGLFVVWREPEQEWDVDEATLEWIQDWTSHKPPLLEAFIEDPRSESGTRFRFDSEKDEGIMPKTENRIRRDDAIRTEFAYLKKQGFKSGHIYRVLAEKYYLSPHRIRDIVTLTREKLPYMAVNNAKMAE